VPPCAAVLLEREAEGEAVPPAEAEAALEAVSGGEGEGGAEGEPESLSTPLSVGGALALPGRRVEDTLALEVSVAGRVALGVAEGEAEPGAREGEGEPLAEAVCRASVALPRGLALTVEEGDPAAAEGVGSAVVEGLKVCTGEKVRGGEALPAGGVAVLASLCVARGAEGDWLGDPE
jgi:hypothetical protein